MFNQLRTKFGYRMFSTTVIESIYIRREICPHHLHLLRLSKLKPLFIRDEMDFELSIQSPTGRYFDDKYENNLLINNFIRNRLSNEFPMIDPVKFKLYLINAKRWLYPIDDRLNKIYNNLKILINFFEPDKLKILLDLVFQSDSLRDQIDCLQSFQIQITHHSTIEFKKCLKFMNNEELKQYYDFDDDLVERRLQLIDYLSEEEKNQIFRKDKDQLLKLDLYLLDSVMNMRLIQYYFDPDATECLQNRLQRLRFWDNFMKLNLFFRAYSKFVKANQKFLTFKTFRFMDSEFFLHIINGLPDEYFDDSYNIQKLSFFFSKRNSKAIYQSLINYMPELTVFEAFNLISLIISRRKFQNSDLYFNLLFRTFDFSNESEHYQTMYKFIENQPKSTEAFKDYLENAMFLSETLNESDFISHFLSRQISVRRRKLGYRSSIPIIERSLRVDREFIMNQISRHPNYNKSKVSEPLVIIDYLTRHNVTMDQIKRNLIILLYSADWVKQKFELLQNDEIYERVKNKDNFIDYLLYFIESDFAFSGRAVFMSDSEEPALAQNQSSN